MTLVLVVGSVATVVVGAQVLLGRWTAADDQPGKTTGAAARRMTAYAALVAVAAAFGAAAAYFADIG